MDRRGSSSAAAEIANGVDIPFSLSIAFPLSLHHTLTRLSSAQPLRRSPVRPSGPASAASAASGRGEGASSRRRARCPSDDSALSRRRASDRQAATRPGPSLGSLRRASDRQAATRPGPVRPGGAGAQGSERREALLEQGWCVCGTWVWVRRGRGAVLTGARVVYG